MKELQCLDDIFNKRLFRIPDYQRGYAWREKQLVEFWEDLISLGQHRSHYTGVLSIKPVPRDVASTWVDEQWLVTGRNYVPFYVVDGQQRLTTISIFLQCLIEAVAARPANEGLAWSDIYLGAYRLSEIRETYVVATEPRHRIINTYKFGYEVDNPSFRFLRHRIFNEPNSSTLRETFYTLNLENAKTFFSENIALVLKEKGLDELEKMYEKLTRRFLFNLYEIDDNFDVFVAFETMNNRGKALSNLELLKNRLIYLTTLYSPDEVSDSVKEAARRNINDTWGEIYDQLGRNKRAPLDDDEFLHAHWIMYFKYSRNTGSDYIRFLLDEYFSPKDVLEKLSVSTSKLSAFDTVSDSGGGEEEDEFSPQPATYELRSKRTIKEINDYVNSLKISAKVWYATFFPSGSEELDPDEQIAMDKLNRVKISYFRPLVMASLLKNQAGSGGRLMLLQRIERFIFIAFRLGRSQANYGSSHFYRAAREIYMSDRPLEKIAKDLDEHLTWAFDGENRFKTSLFLDFISKKFSSNGDGFYAWSDLRYFLYEYEEYLKAARNQPKLAWTNFVRSEKDRVSIEHIYPQTADSVYWIERFAHFTAEQQNWLRGSLGNLLPLSSSINSSLQNDDFPDKKSLRKDSQGKVVRNGYANGSYSELEVAAEPDWTAESIKERGMALLGFIERRWQLNLGSTEKKLALLHLSFLEAKSPEHG